MINKKGSNLIMILSVFVLLISLLFSIVNVTGAWFTDSSADKKTINTVIKTGEANLNVYQEDSAGTQTLLSKSLPTGYTQLEYIESTGTQYIDTGYTANGSTSIDMDFMFTVSKNQALYCSRTSMNSNSFTAFVLPDTIRVDYNNRQITTNLTVKTKTRYRFRNQVDLATLNEKEYNTGVSVSTFTAKPMILFMSYQSYSNGIFSGLGNESCMKLYNFKIYNNGILVRNLVPAKNSSGTIGMYDLVEDKFYTNQGTGTFTAGAEQISGAGVSLAYNTTNKTNNKVTLNDLPTGYNSINYVTANHGEASTKTASINTGVEWKNVGMLECEIEFTTDPTYNPMLFSSYPTAPYIYAGSEGIVFNGITGTVLSTNYTKSQLTNNGLKHLKLKVNPNTSTKVVSFGCWQDTAWSANWNASSVKVYNTSNVLIRDFVACVNGSGTVGMYDLVESKFYTNAGTGTFTSGGEGTQNQLKLLLKNEDLGSSFGIRYKVNFYATTLNGKVLLTSSIAGMTAPTSSTNGFVYNSTDGYYYYKNSSGQNVMFEPATSTAVTSKYLMQSFSIEFSSVANLLGGNSIYMEIVVESVTI